MSKYNALWDYVRSQSAPLLTLSFDEIQQIAGIPIDHSFLQYKKELTAYGWQVQKIENIRTFKHQFGRQNFFVLQFCQRLS